MDLGLHGALGAAGLRVTPSRAVSLKAMHPVVSTPYYM